MQNLLGEQKISVNHRNFENEIPGFEVISTGIFFAAYASFFIDLSFGAG